MVRVNYKNDPREMANISKTRYCYRFNVKLIDGKTMLYPADLKETRIDDSIYSNKHLKDTFGSSVGFPNLQIKFYNSNNSFCRNYQQ